MKRSWVLLLKIVVIALLALSGALLVIHEYYFGLMLVLIVMGVIVISIHKDHQKSLRRMEQMIAGIRYGDMNIMFPENGKGTEGMLNRSMNEALRSFRGRLYLSIVTEAETEAWQKLIRVLTHEIMNSVAPIISLSETVTERASAQNPNQRDYEVMLAAMQSIHRRSKGLLDFVENYRKLTRIPEPDMRFFLVSDLFADLEKLFGEARTDIIYSIKPGDMRLYADRTMIEQALINLIKNAVEACEGDADPPMVLVEAFYRSGKIVFTVRDNGQGIVPEAVDRIFVPFFTTKQGGSGIGLSLSRQIINRHGGSLSVESAPGQGSLFTIVFS